jgi:hypothetical protein
MSSHEAGGRVQGQTLCYAGTGPGFDPQKEETKSQFFEMTYGFTIVPRRKPKNSQDDLEEQRA